jgi:CRISPR/Cas system CMR-associated protein Cmr1 (group 7 of RAMP superfamily)
MDKELKELNKQIEGYVKGRKADESIFNYGVQLGRILEKNKD